MKSRIFTLVLAIFSVVMVAQAASAASIGYSVNSLNGSWAWGMTQWNGSVELGYVDNVADLGTVTGILTGPYVYQPQSSDTANGIYNWPNESAASITLAVDALGGAYMNGLSILSSRSYYDDTLVTLEYSSNGGATWSTILSQTTASLGWLDIGTGGTETEIIDMNLGGVYANMLRLTFDGSQISLHTVSLDGSITPSAVPEPSSFLLLGAGLVGILFARRKMNK